MNKILNIAHRGFSGVFPENTMIAFKKAIEVGCDGIETDVQLTKDDILVLCHDEKIDRTTEGIGLICEYTYKELCQLDAGIKKGQEFKGERIPRLDELLDYVKDKNILINLELKNSIIYYEYLEEKVLKEIYKYKLCDNVIISSFNHHSIKKCRELDKNVKVGVLCGSNLYHPERYAKSLEFEINAIHPSFNCLNAEVVQAAHTSNFKVNTYTVNQKKEFKRMCKIGVDGIITNYPNKLKEFLNR
ncbi:glycerophosphodiester phosphodiesterase [Clostridium ganghwense]|uniref:Glycerophosphodiester phosphodiesterase n=1 Tax=Clostridium ganghwense TaxID=312089 RepID=A0ABT4CQS8_9CLOT|nr:glycerophosphodiester phosphodiesterase [Clostridium ganghwense]MCY6370798.1 glycerophosphodiester phosphodiesterase [Clostridium ganghwense]